MDNPLDYSIKSINRLAPKKGRLLLAEPFMVDPYFKRSVVLLTEHNKNGVLGFILNKPLKLSINKVIVDFPKFEAPIFMGGPVQADTLFYIHTQGKFIADSLDIGNGLYWSGNFSKLKILIKEQQIFPHEIMFFMGYSGWDFDQLEEEINEESWIISEYNDKNIKGFKDINLWQNTLKKMGKKHSLISNFPEDPSLN